MNISTGGCEKNRELKSNFLAAELKTFSAINLDSEILIVIMKAPSHTWMHSRSSHAGCRPERVLIKNSITDHMAHSHFILICPWQTQTRAKNKLWGNFISKLLSSSQCVCILTSARWKSRQEEINFAIRDSHVSLCKFHSDCGRP